jgi:hypothetical protein
MLHRRGPDGIWSAIEDTGGHVLDLVSVGAKLAVDDVYRDGLEDDADVLP